MSTQRADKRHPGLRIRVTPEEHLHLSAGARRERLPLSTWLRSLALRRADELVPERSTEAAVAGPALPAPSRVVESLPPPPVGPQLSPDRALAGLLRDQLAAGRTKRRSE